MNPLRRDFLGVGLMGLARKTERPIAGGFVFESQTPGHRLRDNAAFQAPREQLRKRVVIVGAGVAGLCAAWCLRKRGFSDFVVLELEKQVGGNARWGENEITPYPWAAHYVPVPGKRSKLIRELFEDLGVLRDGVWEERHLCHTPQERLFLHGRWQEGLEPELGVAARDRDEYRRFEDLMRRFHASGEFTIPMEESARESPLDHVSMADWLREQGFRSPYLHWYVNYACRDDYGMLASDASAWAGIHYFAAREPEEKGPLVWPEGNGWIVRRMMERLQPWVRTGALVRRIQDQGRRVKVVAESLECEAEVVIWAAPTFLAPYVMEGAPRVPGFEYSPWITANLTLERFPAERGLELAWDNVIYTSPMLGYVVATHQSLARHQERTVWTWYGALAEGAPSRNREWMLAQDWGYWKEYILRDIAKAHPDIRECVSRMDVWRLGHAMVRPVVGFRSSAGRLGAARAKGKILMANSDLSGLSIFEEAQQRGTSAALMAMKMLGNEH